MSKTWFAGILMLGLVACAPPPAPAAAAASVPEEPAPVVNATPCVLRDLSDCSRADVRRLREQRDRDQRMRDQRMRDERARRGPPNRPQY